MVELWKAIIEHVLGWPVAVVLLGVIYKGPLSTLLRRIHKFGLKGPGVEISGEARQQLDAEIVGPERSASVATPCSARIATPLTTSPNAGSRSKRTEVTILFCKCKSAASEQRWPACSSLWTLPRRQSFCFAILRRPSFYTVPRCFTASSSVAKSRLCIC